MKECGQCALCCKLIDVPGLAGANKWCPNCKPKAGGCQIYDSRPDVCLGFDCFWRAESWPDKLRPDRCKVIFEALPGVETILMSVEPSMPDAWKKPDILKVISILKNKGRPLVVKTKNDSKVFIPEGWTRQDVAKEINQVIDWKAKHYGSTDIHNRP